jgi:hypothetical protein
MYVVDMTFGLNPKQFIYILPQMKLHLHNNINNINIFPFLKHPPFLLAI